MDTLWDGQRLLVSLRRLGIARIALLAFALVFILVLLMWLIQTTSQHARSVRLLRQLWSSYTQTVWIGSRGRTADEQDHAITTSEGQSYTLLRAVWSNDRTVFDTTWRWTAAHIQRPDGLFSWRWGTRPDGTEGILTNQGGQATASDADVDIALALLMAAVRWHDHTFASQARTIIPSIWEHEVLADNGRYYLAADDIEKGSATPWFIINPSYFAPYAYRVFALVDPQHPWHALADDSYATLHDSGYATLAGKHGCGLPPDWAAVDRSTGVIMASPNAGQDADFGFNALRIPWRIALDWQWYHPAEAWRALQQFGYLHGQWQQDGRVLAVYRHDCQPGAGYTSHAMYGGALGYFQAVHRPAAEAIVRSQFDPLLNRSVNSLSQPLRYYDNNWTWFGLALQTGYLTNLAGGRIPS